MRVLAFIDNQVASPLKTENAFLRMKKDYEGVVDVSWQIKRISFADLKWTSMGGGSFILSPQWIENTTKVIYKEHHLEFDHVVFIIARENWKAGTFSDFRGTNLGIGGWSLGSLYNNYSVQLVLEDLSDEWLYKVLAQEVFHALDDLSLIELNLNLDKKLGLDFDEDIVHGRSPDYIQFEYRKPILELRDIISEIYQRRKLKYEAFYKGLLVKQKSLLEQIINLYIKLIAARQLKAKKEPIIIPKGRA